MKRNHNHVWVPVGRPGRPVKEWKCKSCPETRNLPPERPGLPPFSELLRYF